MIITHIHFGIFLCAVGFILIIISGVRNDKNLKRNFFILSLGLSLLNDNIIPYKFDHQLLITNRIENKIPCISQGMNLISTSGNKQIWEVDYSNFTDAHLVRHYQKVVTLGLLKKTQETDLYLNGDTKQSLILSTTYSLNPKKEQKQQDYLINKITRFPKRELRDQNLTRIEAIQMLKDWGIELDKNCVIQ